MKDTNATDAPRVRPSGDPTLLDVVVACQDEIGRLRQQQYYLDSRLARYDRAFEKMFTEEAETRLRLKDRGERGDMAMSRGPLDQIREALEKKR